MGSSLKLQFVRIYLGKQKMDVMFSDSKLGDNRLIQYMWRTRTPGDVPPKNWYKAVFGEVVYQRRMEFKKCTGRALPWE